MDKNKKSISNKILIILLYMCCGALAAIPMIYNELWLITWIALTPVFAYEFNFQDKSKKTCRNAWKRGFLFFVGYGIVSFSWMWGLYPMSFVGLSNLESIIVILLGWIGIPILQGIISSMQVSIFTKLKNSISIWIYPIISACLWVCFEWIQTLTCFGIPWGRLVLGQIGMLQIVQSASILGSYLISFIIVLTSGYLAVAILNIKNFKKLVLCVVIAATIFTSNFLVGSKLLSNDVDCVSTISVAAIQPNIESEEKWSENPQGMLDIQKNLTIEAAASGVDLVVWPETSIPFLVNVKSELKDYITTTAIEANVDIIFGCLNRDIDKWELNNSARYVSKDNGLSDEIYHKQKPVPFGEFIPMKPVIDKVLPILGNLSQINESVSPGKESVVLNTNVGKIGCLVCFDSIYETLAFKSARNGAELLVIPTNDTWFRDSSAVYQHNNHARIRAIETGKYVVRSGNTGISSIITNKGEVIEDLAPLKQGWISGNVKMIKENTVYDTIGNLFVIVCFAVIFVMFIATKGINKISKEKK